MQMNAQEVIRLAQREASPMSCISLLTSDCTRVWSFRYCPRMRRASSPISLPEKSSVASSEKFKPSWTAWNFNSIPISKFVRSKRFRGWLDAPQASRNHVGESVELTCRRVSNFFSRCQSFSRCSSAILSIRK